MKLILMMAVFLAFVIGSASAQSLPRNEKLEAEIRRLDLAHADAILRRDTEALKKLIAEDAVTNHPTNKVVKEREGIFEMIRTGVINYDSFVREPEVFLFYKDMVIVMGHETLTPAAEAPNAGKIIQRRYTNVWMRQKGRWVLAIRHAHIVCTN